MGAVVAELRKAPWTLWAYLGIAIGAAVPGVLLGDHTRLWFLPVDLAFYAVLGFFLLRGSRFMWWLLIAFAVSAVPFALTSSPWWWIPVSIAQLALLLAPPSRRYVFMPKRPQPEPPAVGAAHAGDSGAGGDQGPSPGWYFDPDDPSRMRYWDPRLGGWQPKRIRAPRGMRRTREAEVE